MKDHPRSPRRLVAWLALALLTLASNSVVRTTSICLIFTIFAPSAGLADVFVFSQTGSTVPALRFTSEIDIAGSGSLANLPTIMSDCGMLVCPAPVFAPLTGFEIQGTGSPRFTLVDFKLPVNPAAYDFPMWSISPGGIFFIDEEDNVEYDVRLSSNPVTLIVDDEGSTLGACIEANTCQAFGTFVDVTTAPEPPSWQIFTAALAGMLVVALRKRRAIGGSQRGDRPPA